MWMLRLAVVAVLLKSGAVGGSRNKTVNLDPSIAWFLKFTPVLDLTKIPQNISENCRLDFQYFLKSLYNFELWALKMHDATAKIPSGVFNGNLNQYGDYDQCLNIDANDKRFQGKYCIAYLQPRSKNGKMKDLLKLVQSNEFFKSSFDDCGYRTPRFSHINWAVCVPSSCTHKDLEVAIKEYSRQYSLFSDISVDVKVDEEMCQLKRDSGISDLDANTWRVILLFVLLVAWSGISTLYDIRSNGDKNKFLTLFSLSKGVKELLSTNDESEDDIPCVHGIRFYMAIILMFTHKSMAVLFNPFLNRTEMTSRLANPFLLVYASAASLYTDIFLMLSGLLTTYAFFGKLSKNQNLVVWRELLDRYLRIMPSMIFLILFCSFILPLLGSGPMWNLVVTSHAEICKQHWLRNVLFIQNWFGYNSICLTNTHHVGIDFQLFTLATFLSLILRKNPVRGVQVIVALAILSTAARFYVTMAHELSIHIFFGISLSKIAEVADRMYIIPPYRFTVYSIGMLLGFSLRKFKNHKLTENQTKLGWIISYTTFFVTLSASIRMNFKDYEYNKLEAAIYASLAPALWCVLSAWTIYVSQKGCNSFVVRVFKIKFQKIFTKLSYTVYLTQFPVFFYNVGKVRGAEFFEFMKIMYNVEEFTMIIFCSIALHLLVEAPFNRIRKLVFNKNFDGRMKKEQ